MKIEKSKNLDYTIETTFFITNAGDRSLKISTHVPKLTVFWQVVAPSIAAADRGAW